MILHMPDAWLKKTEANSEEIGPQKDLTKVLLVYLKNTYKVNMAKQS